jgi:hypothetical protein
VNAGPAFFLTAQIVKMLEMADQTHCFVGFSLLKITLFVVKTDDFDVFFAKFASNAPDFTDFSRKKGFFWLLCA